MARKVRRTYSREFKADAVRMVEDGQSAAAVARDLGIAESLLHRWRQALKEEGAEAFPGRGRQAGAEAEIADLKRRLARAEQQREILKKALAYFARETR